jgi:hypothetical protein
MSTSDASDDCRQGCPLFFDLSLRLIEREGVAVTLKPRLQVNREILLEAGPVDPVRDAPSTLLLRQWMGIVEIGYTAEDERTMVRVEGRKDAHLSDEVGMRSENQVQDRRTALKLRAKPCWLAWSMDHVRAR